MLGQVIGVEIPLFPEMETDEMQLRLDQEEAACLGKIAYLKNKITFEEYLDILKMCEVDIDGYLLNLEGNLSEIGLIIL
jgi:hypothetical protein